MKVLKKGAPVKPWSATVSCTGAGNKKNGCGAELLLEKSDLYHTYRTAMGEVYETCVTFRCPNCQAETDTEVPREAEEGIPDASDWKASHRN